ncbi:Uncharacterised protein [Shigella sonnei]|nr:Uncharacterised protein [Shigella sonnei]CSN70360.1 Uncharacterised protein [Shigella sonnei]CSP55676.1 Uncharacterised protein [Shigella sonnei]CSP59347.1 Uncharacterised protein [Shigella sonnei]CSP89026.1 Uncharacterised protein [Shigella sonnei]
MRVEQRLHQDHQKHCHLPVVQFDEASFHLQ